MSKDLKADVIIIGAGIIGASCAFRMSKRGLDEPPGFTEGVDWDWLEPTLQAGVARFPWLAEIRLDHQACWWGYYEVTPDHNPILGRLPSAENWINAAGFSGHGDYVGYRCDVCWEQAPIREHAGTGAECAGFLFCRADRR